MSSELDTALTIWNRVGGILNVTALGGLIWLGARGNWHFGREMIACEQRMKDREAQHAREMEAVAELLERERQRADRLQEIVWESLRHSETTITKARNRREQ